MWLAECDGEGSGEKEGGESESQVNVRSPSTGKTASQKPGETQPTTSSALGANSETQSQSSRVDTPGKKSEITGTLMSCVTESYTETIVFVCFSQTRSVGRS